jgi:hypothetical protein
MPATPDSGKGAIDQQRVQILAQLMLFSDILSVDHSALASF